MVGRRQRRLVSLSMICPELWEQRVYLGRRGVERAYRT